MTREQQLCSILALHFWDAKWSMGLLQINIKRVLGWQIGLVLLQIRAVTF